MSYRKPGQKVTDLPMGIKERLLNRLDQIEGFWTTHRGFVLFFFILTAAMFAVLSWYGHTAVVRVLEIKYPEACKEKILDDKGDECLPGQKLEDVRGSTRLVCRCP